MRAELREVAAHSGDGELLVRSLENTIIHHADYAFWGIARAGGLLEPETHRRAQGPALSSGRGERTLDLCDTTFHACVTGETGCSKLSMREVRAALPELEQMLREQGEVVITQATAAPIARVLPIPARHDAIARRFSGDACRG